MDAQSEAVALKVKAALVRAYGDGLAALYDVREMARLYLESDDRITIRTTRH